MRTRVKICCISSLSEAETAVALGADALGLVGDMPSGPGIISDELARDIAAAVPPPVATFLLTSRTRGDEIAEHVGHCGCSAVQVVQHIDPAEHEVIRARQPRVRRVQVIHVEDAGALELIADYAPYVDAFLLDSGRPTAATPELGGTGRTHDWTVSRDFVARAPRPVFLAGGLKPENVGEAIASVRPYGLDLCSGVRRDDRLDDDLLRTFMTRVRASDGEAAGASR